MNPERLPTTGAGESAEVTVRLTRAELAELDRFCVRKKLTRSRVIRRALKEHFAPRVIGREE
jgi:metal-responsive CopG/Arc/MetJ family transcriptional regulator